MRRLFTFLQLIFVMQLEAKEVTVRTVNLEPIASEKVILTIKIPSGSLAYSHTQIEELGLRELVTTTFWPEVNGEYEGVLLRDLLDHAGITRSS